LARIDPPTFPILFSFASQNPVFTEISSAQAGVMAIITNLSKTFFAKNLDLQDEGEAI